MAQPRGRGQTEQSGGASSARNTVPTSAGDQPPARRFSLSRVVPSRVDRSGDGPQPRRSFSERINNLSGVWKLIITMAIILISAPIGNAILVILFNALHISYTQLLIGKGVPLFGGMTVFTFVYLVYIVAIYFALFKFNIFPRDLFGARARMEARNRDRATRTTSSASSNARASRRAGTRHTTTTTSAAPSARRTAAAAQPSVTGDYDAEHARVKAAQRARRRRETRK